jgi:esterase/lipase superfamily enzyme
VAYTDEQIIEAAGAVLPELERLLGAEASEVKAALSALLARAAAGEQVADAMLELLWNREPLRAWTIDYFSRVAGSARSAAGGGSLPPAAAPAPQASAPTDNAEYVVWYATTRRPRDPLDIGAGYSAERDDTVHYGSCRVFVPRSHKIGSIGSPWWKRLLTLTDDRLRLLAVSEASADDHWREIARHIAAAPPDEQDGLVFVHGYNVTFEQAALRAAQIGFDLSFRGAVSFFSWPSQGTLAAYPADEATIEINEDAIASYLTDFAERSRARAVHVIAHSMGNRGVLRAVARIAADAERRTGVRFGQFILAAADVDADKFRQLCAAYRQVAARTTLYVSARDRAVEASRWLHQFPRVGLAPPVTVAEGLDTVSVTNADLTCLGHGYVAEARDVLVDMHTLIRHNAAPAQRFGLREAVTERGERYWLIGA